VSYRGGEMLENCLQALKAQDYSNLEIIVVDNGSGMHLRKTFGQRHPGVMWITEAHNIGFAGGCNSGIRQSHGDFVSLINDDAMIDPHWTSEMVRCIANHPEAGAVAGLVIDGNQPDIIDSFGVGIALDGMSRQIECGSPANLTREVKEVLAFSGCSCLIRKTAIDDVGMFDERFFAYCEDTDLSLRIIRAGWKIITCPAARSLHHYSHTSGRFSLRKLFLIERNHHWVAIKNYPFLLLLLLPGANLWRIAVQAYASVSGTGPIKGFMGNGFFQVTSVLLKANLSALAGMPAILSNRLRFGHRQKHSTFAMTSILLRGRMLITDVLLSGSGLAPENETH